MWNVCLQTIATVPGKLRERHHQSCKKDLGRILDELVATTGYQRKHVSALLSGKRRRRNPKTPSHQRPRRIYLAEDKRVVLWLAKLFDQLGSKHLRVEVDNKLDNYNAI